MIYEQKLSGVPYSDTTKRYIQASPEGEIHECRLGGTVLRIGLQKSNFLDHHYFNVLFLGRKTPIAIFTKLSVSTWDIEAHRWMADHRSGDLLSLTSPGDELYLIERELTTGFGQSQTREQSWSLFNPTLEQLQDKSKQFATKSVISLTEQDCLASYSIEPYSDIIILPEWLRRINVHTLLSSNQLRYELGNIYQEIRSLVIFGKIADFDRILSLVEPSVLPNEIAVALLQYSFTERHTLVYWPFLFAKVKAMLKSRGININLMLRGLDV
jgi:hypothetical protein